MRLKKLKDTRIVQASIALLLLFAIYGGIHLLRGREIAMPSLFRPASGSRLVMSMEGFTFTQSENGQIAWRMSAESADLFENKKASLREIEIVYSGKGGGEAALRGERGKMNTVTGDATIQRGSKEVRIITSDGYLLTTNSLSWKARESVVRTRDAFKLLGREIYLEGRGLTAHLDENMLEVEKNVKAVLQE